MTIMKKKKSAFAGFLTAEGLAALSATPSTVPQSVQAAKQETAIAQQQNKQQTPVQVPASSQAEEMPTHIGGVPMGNYFARFGRTPKWYGENCVRRGTHKKTNKKR